MSHQTYNEVTAILSTNQDLNPIFDRSIMKP